MDIDSIRNETITLPNDVKDEIVTRLAIPGQIRPLEARAASGEIVGVILHPEHFRMMEDLIDHSQHTDWEGVTVRGILSSRIRRLWSRATEKTFPERSAGKRTSTIRRMLLQVLGSGS